MSTYRTARPAWKTKEDAALASAYIGTTQGIDRPLQAHTEDTPQRPAMPLVGYWVAGGRKTLQKIIGWGIPNMAAALEMVNDHAKRFPDYTFACGMVTATYSKIGWSTYLYWYDPSVKRCFNACGPTDR